MAALPLTGITTSMVAQAIGVGSNDVGTLFLHDNVNEFGFNPPGAANLNAVWGKSSADRAKLSPSAAGYTPIANVMPGYLLGYFRGYDHDWVAYTLEELNMIGDVYEDPIEIRIGLKFAHTKLAGKPIPNPAISHTFKVEFARSEVQFSNGTATVINSSMSVIHPYTSFLLYADNPPDSATNGALEEGETFYIKTTHISSPERRWMPTSLDTLIQSFVTPESAFTNTYSLQNVQAFGVESLDPPVILYKVVADLYADFRINQVADVRCQMSTTSDYSANVYTQYLDNITVPVNDTPGTPSLIDNMEFDFSGTTIKNYLNVGNTGYFRIYVNDIKMWDGSFVVTSTPPAE